MRKLSYAAVAVLLAGLLCGGRSHAAEAGSCDTTCVPVIKNNSYVNTVCTFNWTSSATTGAVTEVGGIAITGELLGINFKSNPAAVPTDLYDVQMLNANGENILSDGTTNVGADVPSAITSAAQRRSVPNKDARTKYLNNEIVTPSIANAGNSKKGIIELFIW